MKIVINRCFGGFELSREAYGFMGIDWDGFGYKFSGDEERTNPKLVECVESLGNAASGQLAELKVVEIPDGVDFEICDYDGLEHVAECHRIWR
ncbi:hypothetical protein [Vibrio phage vB_VviC_ZQ26]|nr:hypothetical protein [Vibrio phage vB_VviC_ZQ26]